MKSHLDNIKSTITISLGLKNRLREMKGSFSYEEYIAQLIRYIKTATEENGLKKSGNYTEIVKYNRKTDVYSLEDFKIVFSYNEFINTSIFRFDIGIDYVRDKGKKISKQDFIKKIKNKDNSLKWNYELYFNLLITCIKRDIEPMFKHKGRIEDYYNWKKEFNSLGLGRTSYEEDVMEKLEDYERGEYFR